MKILLVILTLWLSVSCFGQAFYSDSMLPRKPKIYINTAMPTRTPSATKTLCASGCDYSTWVAMLAAVQKGWTVNVDAGFVDQIPNGTTVTFPNLGSVCQNDPTSADWVIFKTTGAMPAVGVQVDSRGAQAGLLVAIEKNSGTDNEKFVAFASGAGCYRFEGVEPRYGSMVQTADMTHALVEEGDGSDTTPATMVHDIVWSHSAVHGTAISSIRRGLSWQGKYLAFVDSECYEIHEFGADNQCIAGWNGTGPYKWVDVTLSAAGEITLMGGAGISLDPMYETNADIEIRRAKYVFDPNWTYAVIGGPSGGTAATASGGSLAQNTQYWYTAVAGPVSFAGTSGLYGRRLCPELNAGTCSPYVNATTDTVNKKINVSFTTNASAPATSSWILYRTTVNPMSPAVRWVASSWTAIPQTGAGGCGTQNTSCTLVDDGSVANAEVSQVADVGSSQWSIKNLMEFKDAKRVLIDGSGFFHHICCNQFGALVFTPRKSGNNFYASVSDITLTNSIIYDVDGVMNISGLDDNGGMLSAGLFRFYAANLLAVGVGNNVNNFSSGGNDSTLGRCVQILDGFTATPPPDYITFLHLSCLTAVNGLTSNHFIYAASSGDRFRVTRIEANLTNGQITGSGIGEGNGVLSNSWPNLMTDYGTKAVSYNDILGRNAAQYTNWTTGNRFDTSATAGLSNYANCFNGLDIVNNLLVGSNCTVTGGGAKNAAADGTDIGANLPAIVAAEAQVTYPH